MEYTAEEMDEMERQVKEAYGRGVRHAAEIADTYNSSTTHPYMLGDCILSKLNLLPKKKIRKNDKKIKV